MSNESDNARYERLERGLEVEQLQSALLRANRATGVGHRMLAFYLHDMEERRVHQLLGFSSAVHFAVKRLDMNRRTARDLISAGYALAELPRTDEAFGRGELSWTKVRLLAKVASPEVEDLWLERARALSCAELEREVAGAEKGRPPRKDRKGLPEVRLSIKLDVDPLLHEMWEQARAKLRANAGEAVSDADVFRVMAERVLRAGDEDAAPDSLFQVVVDRCSECRTSAVRTADGPLRISEDQAEAVACDAGDIDRPTPEWMRKRVLARDGFRCRSCSGKESLMAHHVVFRSQGGPTKPDNLVTLCSACHSMVHEGLLVVTGQAPHRLEFFDRGGRRLGAVPHETGRVLVIGGAHAPRAPGVVSESGAHAPSDATPEERLDGLIGQEAVIRRLGTAVKAAKIEARPVTHTLISGPPGLGKTTMARAIAGSRGVPFSMTSGPALEEVETLIGLLRSLQEGSVLFIDEIHALPRKVGEMLYEAVQDGRLSLPAGNGVDVRTVTHAIPPFTLIGATTDADRIPRPLLDRFARHETLEPYGVEPLARIIRATASDSRIRITLAAAESLAHAALGIPRRALGLFTQVRDDVVARARHVIETEDVDRVLDGSGIDARGLGPLHRKTLAVLEARKRPVGVARLASLVGVARRTFRELVEGDLLRLGLVMDTRRGLVAVD